MRILVLSDSHGDIPSLELAIKNTANVDAVIFLGDGLADFEYASRWLTGKKIAAVRGNCDGGFNEYPIRTIENFDNKIIYCTHGFSEQVKFGLDKLKTAALYSDATIALFGHTHNPCTLYEDGLYMMNPGSVRQNSCGVIDITPRGIMCFTKKIVM